MTHQLRLVLLAVLFCSIFSAAFAVFPGNCLNFEDGDYITGTGIPTTLTAVTLEGWVNHSDLTGSYQRYLTIGNENAVIRFNGGTQLHFYIKNSAGTLIALTANVLASGEWLHVAGTYNGTTMYLYLNGIQVATSTPSTGGFATCDGTFLISKNFEAMHGKLDDFRFWTTARTQTQIKDNRFTQLTGSETGLRSYWRMDSSSGTSCVDDKGYSNGTMYGMTNANWVASTVPVFVKTEGNAFNFGSDRYANLQQRSSLPIYNNGTSNAYSISMWIKGGQQQAMCFYSETNISNESPKIMLRVGTNGKFSFYMINDAGSVTSKTSTSVVFDNTWHHIAWVDNNGTATLYVDGNADATNFNYTRATTTLNASTLGAQRELSDYVNYFTGQLDEIRFWNVALTSNQVAGSMGWANSPNETGMVCMFQANESSGKVGYDLCRGNNAIFNADTTSNWVSSTLVVPIIASGTISTNTVWNTSKVLVTGDITVNNGVTLTVNPGVTVDFRGAYSLNVQGRLLAVGTVADSINFKSVGTRWRGLIFDSTPATNDSSKVIYCIVQNSESHSGRAGGALYCRNFTKLGIRYSRFSNNANQDADGTRGGGAIYLYFDANLTISHCIFSNNTSLAHGGAVAVSICNVTMENCKFYNNSACMDGGAARNSQYLSSVNCIYKGNHADGRGGAIAIGTGQGDITNCIFDDNDAVYGGAISYQSQANGNILNSTVINNTATYGGGLFLGSSAPKHIRNVVVWGNSASNGNQLAFESTGASNFYYCNIQGGSAGFYGSQSGAYTNCFNLDPLISYSSSNPGSGYVIDPYSPCTNAGDPSTSLSGPALKDINCNARFYNNISYSGNLNTALDRIDCGAIENQNAVLIIPTGMVFEQNYAINDDMYLFGYNSATVNAGVTLSFVSYAHAYIYGNLTAIGTITNRITFTELVSGSGWQGLHFLRTSGFSPSSVLDYCIVEKGNMLTGDATGGNIYINQHNTILIKNSIIRNGLADVGGGIYTTNSTTTLINTIISDNVATIRGPGFYSNTSTVKLTNCTVTANTLSSGQSTGNYPAPIYMINVPAQAYITNCIIYGNNTTAPVYSDNSPRTTITYSDVEGGYTGTGNIDVNPLFTGESGHPYNLQSGSFCINMAKPDTTGLSLPAYDLKNNPRIHNQVNTANNRVDMGAYEYPGYLCAANFTASDGSNQYPGYVYMTWDYNSAYNIPTSGFKVLRNGSILETVDSQTFNYSDYSAAPGTLYDYQIQTYNGAENGYSVEDVGYIKPNGIVSGKVKTSNNNPVMGVKVSISPTNGKCLQLNAVNSSGLQISNPEANMNSNFTMEVWVKTPQQGINLITTGSHVLSITADGKVKYTDGVNTLQQQDLSIVTTDNAWHHIALVNNFTDGEVLMYLDDKQVAINETFIFANYVQSDFYVPVGFTGYMDDIRIWTAARDSSEVVAAMNIVVPYDSDGLKGYWPMNEGTGNVVFDATDYANNANIFNCAWSNTDPGMTLGALTDVWGDYLISQISYGSSTNFAVTPSKPGHVFQPERRLVTLSSSNIAANDVDFTDNSMIPITGYVKFQSTTCPVEGATIYLNGTAAVPYITTDEDGYYNLEVEHGAECVVSVDYKGHEFNRTWNLGEVTYPRSNINFEDIFRTDYQLEVVGGMDSYPIGDFDVTMTSVNGLYTREITGQNWSTGSILVGSVPPLEYNVTVDPTDNDPFNLFLDDQFQAMKTKNLNLVDADAITDTLRYEWRAPLQIEVAWDDSLSLKHLAEYPESEFRVLTQNEWYSVFIRAFEDYSYEGHENQKTFLNDCSININDEVGTKGNQEMAFEGETEYEYTFAPYLPNIQTGYPRQFQKMLEITVLDEALNRQATQTDWVLTQGVKPLESTYATTSPQIPLLILHDPPGDGSSVTFTQSHTHTTSFSTTIVTNQALNMSVTSHLGPNFTFSAGTPFFSKETEVDLTADFSDEWNVEMKQTQSKEKKFTFTTTSELATSSSDDIIGDFGADVFMGAAINLLWGVTKEIYWDYEDNFVNDKSGLMVTPTGFGTQYIYTESQIRNSVIPNLEAIGDTVSVRMWNSHLDMNDYNKAHATDHPDFVDNVSFCAGPSYTMSSESIDTQSKKFEWEVEVSREFGAKIGQTVDGVGTEASFKFKAGINIGKSESEEDETSTKTSITLADDDVASDLTFNSDYFTLDIRRDPVYATPVFRLISGASSSHWEPNTQPRDGVMMTANTYTAVNVPQDQPAYFMLNLSNTSQTNEPRRYFLTVQHGTNNIGALIKINGVPLENQMAFDIDAGASVQAVMSVEPGPMGHELEGLILEFYALGDRGYEGPEDHYFDIFKSFNIYWEAPYSRVRIHTPQDNWLVNSAANDTLNIVFQDYDLNKENFRSIQLQYKEPSSPTWLPAFEVFRAQLENSPSYISVPWDVSSLSDGIYEIRACTTDSVQANWYTDSLLGRIDRHPPEVLGLPQPSDGILQLGDVIALYFTEDINPNSILPGTVVVSVVGEPLVVDCTLQNYNNHITIVPNVANYWMENKTIRVEVTGITDVHGNSLEEEIVWEFFVNSNPVNWHSSKVELIKPLGQTTSFSMGLINTGGQFSSFTLTDLPNWLTAYPMSGSLLPLDSQAISFAVSSQLGFGVFEHTIYADIPGLGREPLVVRVSVLSAPPAWASFANYNYDHTMSITGQMVFDSTISQDPSDIIGAFILNQAGQYECRGVAKTEYLDYGDGSYQFFLTVYSDEEYGEDLLFKLWDASECKEHYGVAEDYTFLSGAVYGTPMAPDQLTASPQLIQNITTGNGWTWLSTNLVNSQSMQVNSFLSTLSPANGDLIKNQIDYAQYSPGLGWQGPLNNIETTKMYKLKLTGSGQISTVGLLEDPNLTPITYGSGWNWISYIPHVSISLGEALENIPNLSSGDVIKGQRAFAQYLDGYGWVGSLRFLNPGEGYQLKTANSGTFFYPDYTVTRSWKRYDEPEVLDPIAGWEINPLEYEYSANITTVLNFQGQIPSQEIILGVFAGDQCRGIASSIEVLGQQMFFLTVYANSVGETLTFKAFIVDTETTVNIPLSLPFIANQVLGNPLNPYVLNLPFMGLSSPKNVRLAIIADQVTLDWDPVTGASSYRVYSSADPIAPFECWDLIGANVTMPHWTGLATPQRKFFRITALAIGREETVIHPESPLIIKPKSNNGKP